MAVTVHSKNYAKVKGFYELYLQTDGKAGWSKEKVRNAVTNPKSAPWITAEEYEEITGEPYDAEDDEA